MNRSRTHSARLTISGSAIAALAVGALVAAPSAGATSAPPSSGPAAAAGSALAADEPGAGFVATAPCSFCELLTDADGMTLYIFTPDPVGEATCTGDCQASWPPLFVTGEVLPDLGELDASLFSLVPHPDGNVLAVNGKALYYFAGDAAPGDTNGQAVGDVWWAVSPDGTFIGAPAAAPAEAAASAGSAAPTTIATEVTTTATDGY